MNNKTSILFVSHLSSVGGAQNSLYLTLKYLDRKRFDPIVALPMEGPLRKLIDGLGIPTFIVPFNLWISWEESNYGFSIWLKNLRNQVEQLSQIIKDHNIDLVHTNVSVVLEAALAAYETNVPHVWHIREMLDNHPSLKPYLPLPLVYTLIGMLSERIVVISEAVRRQLAPYVDVDKLSVVHNGIDVEDFLKQFKRESRSSFTYDRKVGPQIGALGSFSPEKGFDTLIEASALIKQSFPNAKVHIVGPRTNAHYDELLEHKLDSLSLKSVCFLHPFCDDVASFIQQMDIMVIPSIIEPFSRVALESMILQKPIVATKSGGPEEIISNGNTGFLVPTEDPRAMANAILSLLQNPSWAVQLGQRGLERVRQHFDIRDIVRKYEEIYVELANAKTKNRLATDDEDSFLSKVLLEMFLKYSSKLGEVGARLRDLEEFETKVKNTFAYKSYKALKKLKSNLL